MNYWSGKNPATIGPIAEIGSVTDYYYLTDERVTKGFITLNPTGFAVDDSNIKTIPENGDYVAVKASVLKQVLAKKGFTVRCQLVWECSTITYYDSPIDEVLNAEVLKTGRNDIYTAVFLTGGKPAIEADNKLMLLRSGKVIPKVTDPDIKTKICTALSNLIYKFCKNGVTNYGIFKIPFSEEKKYMEVTLRLSEDSKGQIINYTGQFA